MVLNSCIEGYCLASSRFLHNLEFDKQEHIPFFDTLHRWICVFILRLLTLKKTWKCGTIKPELYNIRVWRGRKKNGYKRLPKIITRVMYFLDIFFLPRKYVYSFYTKNYGIFYYVVLPFSIIL